MNGMLPGVIFVELNDVLLLKHLLHPNYYFNEPLDLQLPSCFSLTNIYMSFN